MARFGPIGWRAALLVFVLSFSSRIHSLARSRSLNFTFSLFNESNRTNLTNKRATALVLNEIRSQPSHLVQSLRIELVFDHHIKYDSYASKPLATHSRLTDSFWTVGLGTQTKHSFANFETKFEIQVASYSHFWHTNPIRTITQVTVHNRKTDELKTIIIVGRKIHSSEIPKINEFSQVNRTRSASNHFLNIRRTRHDDPLSKPKPG